MTIKSQTIMHGSAQSDETIYREGDQLVVETGGQQIAAISLKDAKIKPVTFQTKEYNRQYDAEKEREHGPNGHFAEYENQYGDTLNCLLSESEDSDILTRSDSSDVLTDDEFNHLLSWLATERLLDDG